MATFSTNQVKHLYVAKAKDTSLDTIGDIAFAYAGDNQIVAKYVGNDGEVRSDIIDLGTLNIKKVKSYTEYFDSVTITMGNGMTAAGQQYILKVALSQFGGMTVEDKSFIFADYTAKAGDANKNVLANLALALAKNATKAAYSPMIKVSLLYDNSGDTFTEVTATTALSGLTNTYTAIVIEGAEQPWVLGKFNASDRILVDASIDKVIVSGVESTWATIAKNTKHPTAAIVNSKKIADLEAFCFGERADVYRGMGYPNNFEFKPIANPDATYGYHLLDLTWAYQGDAEDIQKSPKELIIAVPAEGLTTYTAMNGIIGTASSGAATGTLNDAIDDARTAGSAFPYLVNFS